MHFQNSEFEEAYDESIAADIPEQDAAYWLTKAAEQGIVAAQFALGSAYRDGYGVRKSVPVAIEWYRKAAAAGHGRAMWWIAAIHYAEAQHARRNPFRRLVSLFKDDKNAAVAIEWYNKVITDGDNDERRNAARCRLGEIYRNGEIVKRDYAKALKYYREVDAFYCKSAQKMIVEIENLQSGKKTI